MGTRSGFGVQFCFVVPGDRGGKFGVAADANN
jgi:hypothetical protein